MVTIDGLRAEGESELSSSQPIQRADPEPATEHQECLTIKILARNQINQPNPRTNINTPKTSMCKGCRLLASEQP